MISNYQTSAIIFLMNHRHRKTLAALLADPVNGNLEGSKIEALLLALGCRLIEGPGSAVTLEHRGRRANFHRPRPAKEALRYRVKAVREFLEKIGVGP
jgi:HicA toxin of bacterial toxin-antitoxin,